MGRRVDIEADHVADLGGELRVAAELEGAQPVRRQAVGAPDLLHRADRQAGDLAPSPGWSSASSRPAAQPRVSSINRAATAARHRRLAGLAGLVAQQPVDTRLHEASLPAPDAGLRHARPAHDLRRAAPCGRGQDDPCPPHMLLGAVPIGHNGFQPLSVRGAYLKADPLAHVRNVALGQHKGNHLFRSDHLAGVPGSGGPQRQPDVAPMPDWGGRLQAPSASWKRTATSELSMSRMMPFGGRRSCTRSIRVPDRLASAAKFASLGSHSASKRPIWLVEAAGRPMPSGPTMARITGSRASRSASLTSS